MDNDLPRPATGPELRDLRVSIGVSQDDLARRLGVHRVTLSGWERASIVNGIKAAKYRAAVRELAAEAVA